MAEFVEVKIKGANALAKKLAELAAATPQALGRALRAEGEEIMTEAKRRTPVLTGTLRGSGHVTGPDEELEVGLRFGGPAAPYAIYVHENLEAYHKVGQAKFLESAVNEAVPQMPARLAKRIGDELAGKESAAGSGGEGDE